MVYNMIDPFFWYQYGPNTMDMTENSEAWRKLYWTLCFEKNSLKMLRARSLLSLKNSFARIFRFLMWIGTDLSISESFSKVIPSLWLKNNLKFLIVKWIWCQWCFVLQLISYPINGQWFGLGPLLKFVVNPTNLF